MSAWSHNEDKCRRRVRCRCGCRRYGLYAILGTVLCNSSVRFSQAGCRDLHRQWPVRVSQQACDGVRRGQENLDGLMGAGMRGRGDASRCLAAQNGIEGFRRRSPATSAISQISDCSEPLFEAKLSSGLMVRELGLLETVASGSCSSLHAKTRCTWDRGTPSSSTSGVRNTAMMWLCGSRFENPEKKADRRGAVAAAFTWSTCSESHHTETPNSEGADLLAAAFTSPAVCNKRDSRKDEFLKQKENMQEE
jgi:hypothetical protein